MSPFTIKRVMSPSEDEVTTCANLMYELQKDIDAPVWLLGGDATLLKDQTSATIRAGALSGEFYIAQNESGEIIGFSVWMPPGQEMFSTPEQRELGLNDLIAKLPDEAREYFLGVYLNEFLEFVGGLLGPTGKFKSWWLNLLMVRRDYQRKGVGTSLVSIIKNKALENHELIACAAVDSRVIPAYESMGFQHIGRKVMKCKWGE